MQAIVLLADAAQVCDGKLSLLGGGWNITTSPTSPSAVAVIVQVPWDQTNRRHEVVIELRESDGAIVQLPQVDGRAGPVQIVHGFEVGRPAGIKPGSSINVPIGVMLGPMPLPPDKAYEWVVAIDGETRAEWRAPFATRPS